jgi:hydrogenase small subunit
MVLSIEPPLRFNESGETWMLPTDQSLSERLEQRGVSRRAFLNFCGVMAATLALPASYRTQIAEALATVRRPVLI